MVSWVSSHWGGYCRGEVAVASRWWYDGRWWRNYPDCYIQTPALQHQPPDTQYLNWFRAWAEEEGVSVTGSAQWCPQSFSPPPNVGQFIYHIKYFSVNEIFIKIWTWYYPVQTCTIWQNIIDIHACSSDPGIGSIEWDRSGDWGYGSSLHFLQPEPGTAALWPLLPMNGLVAV